MIEEIYKGKGLIGYMNVEFEEVEKIILKKIKRRLKDFVNDYWFVVRVRCVEWIVIVNSNNVKELDFLWEFVKFMFLVVINYYFGGSWYEILVYYIGIDDRIFKVFLGDYF